MRSLAADAPGRTRMFWGLVNANGTINDAGSGGWYPLRSGVGIYIINFRPILASPPGVTWIGWAQQGFPYLNSAARDYISFVFSTSYGGAAVDTAFQFTAMGRAA